jgi:hypothetical protein
VPDATTVWLFREALAKAGLVAKLFVLFNQHLEAKGYIARGGQIVDATIVSAPVQHNSRSENEAIKAGKTPEGWQEKPAKNAQKDKDALWTKKHDHSFYGYKNHIGIDRMHKLIRRYARCSIGMGSGGASQARAMLNSESRLQPAGIRALLHPDAPRFPIAGGPHRHRRARKAVDVRRPKAVERNVIAILPVHPGDAGIFVKPGAIAGSSLLRRRLILAGPRDDPAGIVAVPHLRLGPGQG